MEEVPQVFDWVTARGKCSSETMFALLIETVDSDAKAMNELGRVTVQCYHASTRKIVVSRSTQGDTTGTVIFERTNEGLSVSHGSPSRGPFFEAVPSLQADGRCRYEIDGVPHELWQVSRKALESLFFRG